MARALVVIALALSCLLTLNGVSAQGLTQQELTEAGVSLEAGSTSREKSFPLVDVNGLDGQNYIVSQLKDFRFVILEEKRGNGTIVTHWIVQYKFRNQEGSIDISSSQNWVVDILDVQGVVLEAISERISRGHCTGANFESRRNAGMLEKNIIDVSASISVTVPVLTGEQEGC